MQCPKCQTSLTETDIICSNCGNKIFMNSVSTHQESPLEKKSRAKLILIFGILSVVIFGPLLGIPALIIGSSELKKIDNGIVSPSDKGLIKAGIILGVIGTILGILAVVLQLWF